MKRLRPAELGPFDYENENITRSLWIAEGFTDYYADLQVLTAPALQTRDEYLEDLSSTIEVLQTTPGRLVQSAEMASFDAWIKYYRPDENSNNTSISYYTKGTVIAFLLDAKIRKATNGAKSLDDVMRTAYQKFSGPKGYTPEEFRAVAEQVAGIEPEGILGHGRRKHVRARLHRALDTFGLASSRHCRRRPTDRQNRGWASRRASTTAVCSSRRCSAIRRPTWRASTSTTRSSRSTTSACARIGSTTGSSSTKPGDKVAFLVARREQLVRIPVTFGAEPAKGWRLELNPAATDTQRRQLDAWLRGQP